MRYQYTIEIDLPISEVSAKFQDLDNLHKWQEGLKEYKHLSGTPGQPGAKMHLRYEFGKRKLEMTETIMANQLPERFDATYDVKGYNGVHNISLNRFASVGLNKTRWTQENEFQLSGFMKLVGLFFPGMLKKQTWKMMSEFKRFAES
jgi:hypothetical protein